MLRRILVVGVTAAFLAGATLVAIRSHSRRAEALSRVVVMPFENRTGEAGLDALGAITADWVAQGLNEPGFLTVLDTRSALAAAARLGAGASPVAIGRETGAGVVVAGSYFLQGDSIQFPARIVSARDGSILTNIGGIVATRGSPLVAAEQLRQRVLGAFASLHEKDVATFETGLSQPPTYDAYRAYTAGLERYMRFDYPEAARHFERAAALDSTFLTARLWAAQSLWPDGPGWQRGNTILAQLEPLRDRLSPFDRARFDFVVSLRDWQLLGPDDRADPLQANYRAAQRMVVAAPGSVDAQRELALAALRVFRPREALRLLSALDPERGLMREWEGGYWIAVAWAHHLLGDYDEELVAARRGRSADPPGSVLSPELRALAALGRVTELDSLAHAEFRTADQQWVGTVAYELAGELLAHGHPELARRLAHDAAELLAAHPPPDSAGAQGRDEWLRERAWLALLLSDNPTATECVGQFRNPEEQGFLVAHVLAAQGRRDAALAALEAAKRHVTRLGQIGGPNRGMAIEAAGVLVRLGDLDGALDALAQTSATDWYVLGTDGRDGHAEPELAPLWTDLRFRALIKPRG